MCMLLCAIAKAQDTTLLKEIEVTTLKTTNASIGKKVQTIDTTIKKVFVQSNLGDILSVTTPIHIKNYGSGAISTTSFRGGNANQTAILWNGFNLKNAMLGHIDLSLLPANLFNNVSVEYGGGSATWGSDAVGGSIHLNNKATLHQNGFLLNTNTGWASFGNFNANLNAEIKHNKFSSKSFVYSNTNQNKFKYIDTLNKEQPNQIAKHAFYSHNGLMQTLDYRFSNQSKINVSAWYHTSKRHLPNFFSNIESKRYQFDKALRLTTNYNYSKNKYNLSFKNAFFNDVLNYTDSAINLFSKSNVNTLVSEVENFYQYHNHQQLQIGLNFTQNKANSTNYSSNNTLTRFAINIANKSYLIKSKLITYAALRVEHISLSATPITGNVSADYLICNFLKAKLNLAKVYRQPTLNELFWQPGGNPNLKAEQGYSQDGELEYNYSNKKISLIISGAAYNRIIDNWILWTPGANGNPQPLNLQQVWSRGTETNWRVTYKLNKSNFGINVVTGYCLSTINKDNQTNSATLHQQLIYTPRYTVNSNLFYNNPKFSFVFFHQYVGYRFTSSDNLNWLNPYHVLSVRFTTNFNAPKDQLNFYFAANNILNNNYVIVANKPMPLRNFELGISILLKKTKP